MPGKASAVDWDGTLDELRAGRTLFHVLRERRPDRPETSVWYRRIKTDPVFAAGAARALEVGRGAREANAWSGRFTCDEEVAAYLGGDGLECLLCRVAGFRSLGQHLASEHATSADAYRGRFGIPRGRALTTKTTGEKLRARPPGARALLNERDRERRAAVDWDAALAKIEAGAGIGEVCIGGAAGPTYKQWLTHRAENEAFADRAAALTSERSNRPISAETLETVASRIQAGDTFDKAAEGLRITRHTIWKYQSRNERFGQIVREALLARRRVARPKQPPIRPNEHLEIFRAHLNQNEVFAIVSKALPRWMPPHMREDVRSDAILAVIEEGVVSATDVAAVVKRCVRDYGRMFNSWQASLDDTFGEGGFTRGDTLAGAYF